MPKVVVPLTDTKIKRPKLILKTYKSYLMEKAYF
jgi:hypothetical protein